MKFDPFEDRASRDIRNNLGHLFIKAIQKNQADLFTSQVKACLGKDHPAYIKDYIRHRNLSFHKIFDRFDAKADDPGTFWDICLALWNNKLFFECHEWLEEKWINSRGNQKKAYQALILSAVTYELLEYGRTAPAQKLSVKAAALLIRHKKNIPALFDIDTMIKALTHLLPAPAF